MAAVPHGDSALLIDLKTVKTRLLRDGGREGCGGGDNTAIRQN